MIQKRKAGRPVHTEKDLKVIKYRLQDPPMTFKKISEKTGEDIKSVYMRFKRVLAKLSTG